jgi:hypothetical protein
MLMRVLLLGDAGPADPAARHASLHASHRSRPEPRFRPIGPYAPGACKARGRAPWFVRALGLALLCADLLGGCRAPPPEQALRDTIAAMETAAEDNDSDALFASFAEDFTASEGMDRRAFRQYVTLLRLRNAHLSVTLGPIDVKLFGDRATADFTCALAGGAGLLPSNAQVYDVSTGWRMEGGEWKLISAKWAPKL